MASRRYALPTIVVIPRGGYRALRQRCPCRVFWSHGSDARRAASDALAIGDKAAASRVLPVAAANRPTQEPGPVCLAALASGRPARVRPSARYTLASARTVVSPRLPAGLSLVLCGRPRESVRDACHPRPNPTPWSWPSADRAGHCAGPWRRRGLPAGRRRTRRDQVVAAGWPRIARVCRLRARWTRQRDP